MPEERAVSVRVVADLGLFDVVMMGLGAMIGTSIYVLLGGAALVGGVAVGWALLLNGGLVLLTAIAYVELGAVMPRAGGGYAWVKEGLPPPFGFSLFYLRSVAPPRIKTADIYKGVMPFVGVQLIALLLVVCYPQLVTMLNDKTPQGNAGRIEINIPAGEMPGKPDGLTQEEKSAADIERMLREEK